MASAVHSESPSLYKKMKASTSSAERSPWRPKNSRKGSTTASRRVRGARAAATGSRTSRVISRPGAMNSAVITNTCGHGRRSASTSARLPGTRPASL